MNERGHACELDLRQLVVEHRRAEYVAVLRVRQAGFERRLHEADGARRGLKAPVFEAGHLEVEAAAETGFTADEVRARHEPVVERDFVGVHAAVTDGVDRATFDVTAPSVVERERVSFGAVASRRSGSRGRGGRPSGRGPYVRAA